MLILNPAEVTFGAATWSDVTAVSIERRRSAEREAPGVSVDAVDAAEDRLERRVGAATASGASNVKTEGASGRVAWGARRVGQTNSGITSADRGAKVTNG